MGKNGVSCCIPGWVPMELAGTDVSRQRKLKFREVWVGVVDLGRFKI